MLVQPNIRLALAAFGTTVVVVTWSWLTRSWRGRRHRQCRADADGHDRTAEVTQQKKQRKSRKQQPIPEPSTGAVHLGQKPRDKGRERLEWWQRLNEVKPALILPDPRQVRHQGVRGNDEPAVYRSVVDIVKERLGAGKDWLVRDSQYGEAPAHSAVKAKVNSAIVGAVLETFGESLAEQLAADFRRVVLLLDTPLYRTLHELAAAVPRLRFCPQVVIPQADLRHYFEMIRGGPFHVGVRAQRLDHWLCANAELGLRCLVAFLDFECRLVGARSARLCPAADVMRYFRLGYPAEPESVLAITVGLEDPAPTPEDVDAFVRWEAHINGYEAELKETWKYRMVSLLYIVRSRSE
mmetsp:Transcript_150720/g.420126  ORF Transcript_150720/g.420126 Transcript_150720/m.420126 type:complete len:352 (+) Transcript_150720:93-1148(+)